MHVGDYLRPFNLPSTIDDHLRGDDCVGNSLVLVFYLKDGAEEDAKLLSGFRDLHEEFLQSGINVVAVGLEPIESHKAFAEQLNLKLPLLSDQKLQLSRDFGVLKPATIDGKPGLQLTRHTFFLDVSLRVVKVYENPAVEGHAQEVLAESKAWLDRDPARCRDACAGTVDSACFPADLCRELMAAWETQNEESGFMKQVDGKTVGVTDYSHKIRRDHYLTEGPVHDRVKGLHRRAHRAGDFQGIQLSRDAAGGFPHRLLRLARGGYFRPHRDNTTGGTAHRRFAMSLLLNDDYDGGYLRFPEYGMHRYRPQAGGACVFSCSLLHEATDITAGRRFVLLQLFLRGCRSEDERGIQQTYGWYLSGVIAVGLCSVYDARECDLVIPSPRHAASPHPRRSIR